MPGNWFNRLTQDKSESQNRRYRAMVPIDAFIPDSGDEERNTDIAYNIMSDDLSNLREVNYQLSPSSVSYVPYGGVG